ncbi:MAG: hypothetical protein M0D57_09410 [Sphingobacteriales bacterium JAD_PAG50586_3]|nr:MAG: hypothetical protein M0D57_09410 [Sphingobacteriales bacterium JAD_PAG50586_3]
MFATLLSIHSFMRWLVLASLLYSIYRAYNGYIKKSTFTKADNSIRHWTATISHIQLTIGLIVYMYSPVIKYFRLNFSEAVKNIDTLFFGLIHITLMITSVVLITIGSALAKRKAVDNEKFKTMLVYFGTALLIIFIAIPWPFSPLAQRPYIRPF